MLTNAAHSRGLRTQSSSLWGVLFRKHGEILEVTHSEREDDSVAFPERVCETLFTLPSIPHSQC